jgi:subtilisin-like proprotein convertase family protein
VNLGNVVAGQSVASVQNPIAIPDANLVGITGLINSNIQLQEGIERLTVQLRIDHPDTSQLSVTLTSPAGTEVVLHEAGAGQNINTRYGRETLPASSSLERMVGEDASGVWRLVVIDADAGAEGTLHSWSLHFDETFEDGTIYAGNDLEADGWLRTRSGIETLMGSKLVMRNQAGNAAVELNSDNNQGLVMRNRAGNVVFQVNGETGRYTGDRPVFSCQTVTHRCESDGEISTTTAGNSHGGGSCRFAYQRHACRYNAWGREVISTVQCRSNFYGFNAEGPQTAGSQRACVNGNNHTTAEKSMMCCGIRY